MSATNIYNFTSFQKLQESVGSKGKPVPDLIDIIGVVIDVQ